MHSANSAQIVEKTSVMKRQQARTPTFRICAVSAAAVRLPRTAGPKGVQCCQLGRQVGGALVRGGLHHLVEPQLPAPPRPPLHTARMHSALFQRSCPHTLAVHNAAGLDHISAAPSAP